MADIRVWVEDVVNSRHVRFKQSSDTDQYGRNDVEARFTDTQVRFIHKTDGYLPVTKLGGAVSVDSDSFDFSEIKDKAGAALPVSGGGIRQDVQDYLEPLIGNFNKAGGAATPTPDELRERFDATVGNNSTDDYPELNLALADGKIIINVKGLKDELLLSDVNITRSGSIATVTAPNTYINGQRVNIVGADQAEYNVTSEVISNVTASSFEFTVTGTPVTPATGTIDVTLSSSIIETADSIVTSNTLVVLDPTAQMMFLENQIVIDSFLNFYLKGGGEIIYSPTSTSNPFIKKAVESGFQFLSIDETYIEIDPTIGVETCPVSDLNKQCLRNFTLRTKGKGNGISISNTPSGFTNTIENVILIGDDTTCSEIIYIFEETNFYDLTIDGSFDENELTVLVGSEVGGFKDIVFDANTDTSIFLFWDAENIKCISNQQLDIFPSTNTKLSDCDLNGGEIVIGSFTDWVTLNHITNSILNTAAGSENHVIEDFSFLAAQTPILCSRTKINNFRGQVTTNLIARGTEISFNTGFIAGGKVYLESDSCRASNLDNVLNVRVGSLLVDPTLPPPTEVTGDRYYLNPNIAGAVHGDWDGAAKGTTPEFDTINPNIWAGDFTPSENRISLCGDVEINADDTNSATNCRTVTVNN